MEKEKLLGVQRLHRLRPRVLWIVLTIVCSMVFIRPIGIPLVIDADVKKVYDTIQALPPGSLVHTDLAGFLPIAISDAGYIMGDVVDHLFRRGCKIVFTTGTGNYQGPAATPYAYTYVMTWIQPTIKKLGLQYGKDWVYIGYLGAADSDQFTFVKDVFFKVNDYFGTPLKDIPLMKQISGYGDFKFVYVSTNWTVNTSALTVSTYHQITVRSEQKSMIQSMKPYVPSIYVEVIGGVTAAAEYEQLLGAPGNGAKETEAGSVGMLTILGFIVLGNIGYYFTIKGKPKPKAVEKK